MKARFQRALALLLLLLTVLAGLLGLYNIL